MLSREVKAKLPRDALLNPKGTGLWKTPFRPLCEAGSFRLGLCRVPFAGNPGAWAGTEKASFGFLLFFLYGSSLEEAELTRRKFKFETFAEMQCILFVRTTDKE